MENGEKDNFSEWGVGSPQFNNCCKYFSEELYSRADTSTMNEEIGKNEAIFLAVVREMNEESRNEGIVTINEDQTQTPYPVEV